MKTTLEENKTVDIDELMDECETFVLDNMHEDHEEVEENAVELHSNLLLSCEAGAFSQVLVDLVNDFEELGGSPDFGVVERVNDNRETLKKLLLEGVETGE